MMRTTRANTASAPRRPSIARPLAAILLAGLPTLALPSLTLPCPTLPCLGLPLLALLGACSKATADRPAVQLNRTDGIDADVVARARAAVSKVEANPADAERRAELALVYEANELWDESVRAWRDALALAPERSLWRLHYSICANQSGESEAAMAEMQRVVEELPEQPAARMRLGEMLLEIDEVEGAQLEFEKALTLAPQAPDCYASLAAVMLRKDEYQRAAELCERAIELDPGFKLAHYNLGLAYRGLGRMSEAEDALNRGLNAGKRQLSDPLSRQVDAQRTGFTVRLIEAGALEKAGNIQAAIQILEGLRERYPDDTTVLNNLSAVYLQSDRNPEALALLKRARDLDPGEFSTYLNLATAQLALDNPVDALEAASKAVELAPKHGQVRFIRARALVVQQRFSEAYQELERSVALDATNGLAYCLLADMATMVGEPEKAVVAYQAAKRILPDLVPAHYGLTQLYLRLGRLEEARECFKEVQRLAPTSQRARALGQELGVIPR